jgi:hypothetical protein
MQGYRKIFSFTFALLFLVVAGYAQTQDSYEYQSEFTWGINKNTYGGLIGGLFFKKARKLKNDRILETYGLEIMNVKHPQEVRKTSGTGNFFIAGKANYLYAFRFQYGRDIILFKKAPQQGVEIKAVFAAGPTLGILAPYYVEYSPQGGGGTTYFAQYNPELAKRDEVLGTGRLFQGLGESKIKFGGNFKAALNFELGTIKSQVTGFEAGFLLDAYTDTIDLLPETENYSVFPTLFIAIFYGSRK